METIILINLILFLIVFSIRTFIGLDVRKWTSWLYGLYGFFSGFWCSFIREDAEMSSRLLLGALFAFAIMYIGAFVRVNRQRYK
jgi:hypothetical protein